VTPRPGALLFDFDGLVLDTETCTYEAVVAIFAEHGLTVDLAWWHSILGTANHVHWADVLAEQYGRPVDRETLIAAREAHRLPRIRALAPCAGVVELLGAAASAGIPCAVASSSAARWVVPHLERLGLADRFAEVVTSDDVAGDRRRTKPAPDLFLVAAGRLGIAPRDCVVLEDSPNGVAAGRAAGMTVVAVPGPMTADLDFSAAHLVVPSLADLEVSRLGWLAATV
jgi:HAD superfamily hydrolase (TIGR01509 family)